jgi:hypothetical protein
MNRVTSVALKTLEAPKMIKKYYERKKAERYIDQTNSVRSYTDLKSRFSPSIADSMDPIFAVRRANGIFDD